MYARQSLKLKSDWPRKVLDGMTHWEWERCYGERNFPGFFIVPVEGLSCLGHGDICDIKPGTVWLHFP